MTITLKIKKYITHNREILLFFKKINNVEIMFKGRCYLSLKYFS